LRTSKKIYRDWEEEGGESCVRKGRNGRKSLRRLKPQWVVTPIKEEDIALSILYIQRTDHTLKFLIVKVLCTV
jgi:hypothetical protein